MIMLAVRGATSMQELGARVAEHLRSGDVLLLSGDLGAGKTQLTKGIGAGLGVVEPVTSPTFNILLVHEARVPLNHFDLYRLDRADQLEDIDYFGTLESGAVSVVEWGDRFGEAAPPDGVSIGITIEGDEDRRVTVTPLGPRGREIADAFARVAMGVDGVRVEGEQP